MIHLNPYRLMAGGRQIGADYVVAVATEERYRHRGYMAQLLRQALEDGRRRGNPFAFLIPANPAIYEPFGFRYVSASRELCWKPGQDQDKDKDKDQEWLPGQAAGQLPAGEMPAQTGRLSGQAVWLSEEGDFREAAALASSCLAGRCSVYAIRDAAYYRRLRLECMAEERRLLGCRSRDGELQAFLACTVSQEAVEVREPFERELCAGAGQKFPENFQEDSQENFRGNSRESIWRRSSGSWEAAIRGGGYACLGFCGNGACGSPGEAADDVPGAGCGGLPLLLQAGREGAFPAGGGSLASREQRLLCVARRGRTGALRQADGGGRV